MRGEGGGGEGKEWNIGIMMPIHPRLQDEQPALCPNPPHLPTPPSLYIGVVTTQLATSTLLHSRAALLPNMLLCAANTHSYNITLPCTPDRISKHATWHTAAGLAVEVWRTVRKFLVEDLQDKFDDFRAQRDDSPAVCPSHNTSCETPRNATRGVAQYLDLDCGRSAG